MIATEAGAEGINLQFCSLVVNYDLPWNPQRIEQRIGRCHRYGQQHDVVVVNFLNRNNEADQRVFQLLSEKFQLFEGVFGARDEVLGAIESGVDFEKRIVSIYQRCRTSDEIRASFDQLQQELSAQIDQALTRTRNLLLENFDDEVREKLRVSDDSSRQYLNRYERMLMQLTRHELDGHAEFQGDSAFRLKSCPFQVDIPLGLYELPRRSGEAHLYRLSHPLAYHLLEQAKKRSLQTSAIVFAYSHYEGRIAAVEPLVGKSGFLSLSLFTVESLGQAEDYLIFTGVTEEGEAMEEEVMRRLFSLSGRVQASTADFSDRKTELEGQNKQRQDVILRSISQRNAALFEAEVNKLDAWTDDFKAGLERELKDLDREIKEVKREARETTELEPKVTLHKHIKELEKTRNEKRRSLFDAQDEIDARKEALIAEIEARLKQQLSVSGLFVIRWQIE